MNTITLNKLIHNEGHDQVIPITTTNETVFKGWLEQQTDIVQAWSESNAFTATPGQILRVPGVGGTIEHVVFGLAQDPDLWDWSPLAEGLGQNFTDGIYQIKDELTPEQANQAALGWAVAGYSFDRYSKKENNIPSLVWPSNCDQDFVTAQVEAITLVRDLVNTPANDMGPEELAEAACDLFSRHHGESRVIVGEDLLEQNFPAIHSVGRASSRPPRLIDLCWGDNSHPKVTLIGKGVCFDSGGLNLKLNDGMTLMKKDMGGAAHVLGIANMVMALELPIRLRVLIPAVENSVSGNALRPLDVITTNKGLTVEITNTDAEGRVVLADALSEASRENPELILDFATLTGAARVALGTDLPAMFTNDDGLAKDLETSALTTNDPFWRMPLWPGYKSSLKSQVADLINTPGSRFGGAITAALFLEEFVGEGISWAHFDIIAWNLSSRPGRPEGGEAMVIRTVIDYLRNRYA